MADPADPAAGDDRVEVVFLSTPTSGVGRRLESVLASFQTRNRARVVVRAVDAASEPQRLAELDVEELPSIVFLREGRPVARVGARATLQELQETLEGSA